MIHGFLRWMKAEGLGNIPIPWPTVLMSKKLMLSAQPIPGLLSNQSLLKPLCRWQGILKMHQEFRKGTQEVNWLEVLFRPLQQRKESIRRSSSSSPPHLQQVLHAQFGGIYVQGGPVRNFNPPGAYPNDGLPPISGMPGSYEYPPQTAFGFDSNSAGSAGFPTRFP